MRFGEHKYKTLQIYQCNTCAYTDADLAESYTDPHIKTTKNSSEMICIGFASHMRRKPIIAKPFRKTPVLKALGKL